MSTRGQIRSAVRVLIDQTDASNSRFTDAELNTIINEAQDFVSDSIGFPRDVMSVVVEASAGRYILPTDNLFVKQAWFGHLTSTDDGKELEIISLRALSSMYPAWWKNNSQQDGVPALLVQLDKSSVFVFPRPNATESGKSLIIANAYRPAVMTDDNTVSDVPVPFHHLITLYAAHLCYLGKLDNADRAQLLFRNYGDKLKMIENNATMETEASRTFEFIDLPDVE